MKFCGHVLVWLKQQEEYSAMSLGSFLLFTQKVSGVGDEVVRCNVCVLSQAMANICSTVEGREYFLHPKAAR